MAAAASIELGELTALERELIERAAVIGSIYGILFFVGLLVAIGLLVRWRQSPPPWRELVDRLTGRSFSGRDFTILTAVLLAGFVATLYARHIWLSLTAHWNATADARLMILQSVGFHLLGLSALTVLLHRRQLSWMDTFGFSAHALPRELIRGLVGLIAVLPVLLVVTLVYHLALTALGYRPSLQEVALIFAEERNPWLRAYFVFLALLLAPLFEELYFRGLLFPLLARRFGGWGAALFSSFIFAAIHGHLPSFAPLFLLAMALATAYTLTGSLGVAIAMHALFNGLTAAIILSLSP